MFNFKTNILNKYFKNFLFKIDSKKGGSGFTVIELLLVVSIISFIASIILVSFNDSRLKARNAKRVADFTQVIKGLDLYLSMTGDYPTTTCDNGVCSAPIGCGGFDTTKDGSFLINLKNQNITSKSIDDPKDQLIDYAPYFGFDAECGNYFYRYYPNGLSCSNNKPFYVLGIMKLEKGKGTLPKSPNFVCNPFVGSTWADWWTGGIR